MSSYYFGKTQSAYISQCMAKRMAGGWDWVDFERKARHYEPSTEVVFLFLRADGSSSGYCVHFHQGKPTPSAAYTAHRDELGDLGKKKAN